MVLNYIWIFFIVIGFIVGIIKLVFLGDLLVLDNMQKQLFEMSKTGFEIALYLTPALAFWMGILKIAEKVGAVDKLAKFMSPFFIKIFPEIPIGHKSFGSMMMNFSANMLGLDNAATPFGLQAMSDLQELNPKKETATNSQIMFLVLNTSGLTLIPVSIMAIRASAEFNVNNPADVFIPILLATFSSSFMALIIMSIIQKINLFNKVVLLYLGTLVLLISLLVSSIIFWIPSNKIEFFVNILASLIIFSLISLFLIMGLIKKMNIYEYFIDGAKEGFNVAIKIIPFLISILVAIGVFRASGCMQFVQDFFRLIFGNKEFVEALPTAIMKPLSGSGARGMMVDSWKQFGAESQIGYMTAIIQGSTETTFYVLAVYFGSVGIKNTRYSAIVGLIADFIGIIVAILIAYLLFSK